MTSHTSFGTVRVVVATLLLSLVALSIAVAMRQGEVEPPSDPVPQVTTPTAKAPSEPALAEKAPPQVEEIQPPEVSDPGESIEAPAIESLLDEEQRSAVANALRIEGLGDTPPGQTQTADAAVAFVAAVDRLWWWYRRTWGRKPSASTPSYELLWAALRDGPRGLESGSLAIRATPRPDAGLTGVTFTNWSRPSERVEVHFGFGTWDFVLEIHEAAVPPEIWSADRQRRPGK
ncbi:MAG: hypothetical protein ABL997_11895 [Planctomycetota bacterium]